MLRAAAASNECEPLCGLLRAHCGLILSDDKRNLVAKRLRPIMLQAGIADLGDLAAKLVLPGAEALMARVIDALSSHETAFFRNAEVFRYVRETMLPALLKLRRGQRRIRIWCAAAATGQEPYSLAMMLADMPVLPADWQIDLVASDLSGAALTRAREGAYSQSEVQCGLPIALLVRHFTVAGDVWRIASDLRAKVSFRQVNLLNDFSALGRFDVVLCRNVLAGFEPSVRHDVLSRIVDVTACDGYVVLGAGETMAGGISRFSAVNGVPGVFMGQPARGTTMLETASAHGCRFTPSHLTVVASRDSGCAEPDKSYRRH